MIGLTKSIFGAALIWAMAPAASEQWPSLPSQGFINGRAGTTNDVGAGNAVFSMEGAGRPLSIAIPQYAYWTSGSGERVPVIVVQAEIAPNGDQIIGLRKRDGSEIVATRSEVTLLGTERPR
jgi:hypothetical protein